MKTSNFSFWEFTPSPGRKQISLFSGITLLLIGFILLLFPDATLAIIMFLLGCYWFTDGILSILNALGRRKIFSYWWWGLITGGLSTIAGMFVLSKPLAAAEFTTSFLFILLGAAALLSGIERLATGITLRKMKIGNSLIGSGVVALVLALIFLSSPFATALFIIKILGLIMAVVGIAFLVRAYIDQD